MWVFPVLLAAFACGQVESQPTIFSQLSSVFTLIDPYIIGGKEATAHDFPFQAGIFNRKRGINSCGGVLIHPEWVLTAAHCLKPEYLPYYEVVLGAHNVYQKEEGQQRIQPMAFLIHGKYAGKSNNYTYDIGLIRLSKPAELNDKVQVVRLPSNAEETFANQNSITTGWGGTKTDADRAIKLRLVNTRIMSPQECGRQGRPGNDNPLFLCLSGDDSKGPCKGDSGGPTVVRDSDGEFTVVGITSHGNPCGATVPSIQTRLSTFLDWINEHVNSE